MLTFIVNRHNCSHLPPPKKNIKRNRTFHGHLQHKQESIPVGDRDPRTETPRTETPWTETHLDNDPPGQVSVITKKLD